MEILYSGHFISTWPGINIYIFEFFSKPMNNGKPSQLVTVYGLLVTTGSLLAEQEYSIQCQNTCWPVPRGK